MNAVNGDVLIVGIVIVTALLLLAAGLMPRFKKYRFVFGFRKVEPRKKSKPTKKRKSRR